MSNELENDLALDMSPEELHKTKSEMMRYRSHSLSYWLGFGAIGFSVFGSFVCLNSFQPTTVLVILKILLNIVILLFGFLSCEKAKAYSKQASISLICIGSVCALRILWVPLQIFIYFNKFLPAQEWLTEADRLSSSDPSYVVDAAKLASNQEIVAECSKYLGSTITDYYSGNAGNINWLPANGNFRAILAIVLLSCAAVFFISAGLVGLIRSKRLENYMSSINKD